MKAPPLPDEEKREKEKEEDLGYYCSDSYYQYYINNWNETYIDFKKDLLSSPTTNNNNNNNNDDDFHAFQWTLKLLEAGLLYCYVKFGFYKINIHIYWRCCVPALALTLILLVIASYYASLKCVIKERWCCTSSIILLDDDEEKTETNSNSSSYYCEESCRWQLFHDFVVAYLGIMILFNFLSACFRSPGVVLPTKDDGGQHQNQDLLNEESPNEYNKKWSSIDSRGGFCFIDPILNIVREESLVKDYYALTADISQRSRNKYQCFPSCQETYCSNCRHQRPPRCHHCSTCRRCILQFDHHCIWLNNCVGYNNHRAFLLTLFYLSLGCWYGCLMLCRSFFGLLNEHVNDHGWHIFYENKTCFLDLPPLSIILSSLVSGTVEKDVIIKLVFPFLTAVAFLQTVFFGYHMLYVVSALTTLEYKILLDMQYNHLVENKSRSFLVLPNTFSLGWYQNLKTALGYFPFIFLPIQVNPRPMNRQILNTYTPKKET